MNYIHCFTPTITLIPVSANGATNIPNVQARNLGTMGDSSPEPPIAHMAPLHDLGKLLLPPGRHRPCQSTQSGDLGSH